MKTDLYTKAMLTVIASCLTIMVIKNVDFIPKANAATSSNGLKNYGMVPLNADGSINVTVKSYDSPMKVELVDINTSDELNVRVKSNEAINKVDLIDINTSDKLNVSIKEVDNYAFNYCTVPVKMKE